MPTRLLKKSLSLLVGKEPGLVKPTSQLELPIEREISLDRNADKGGRSFYFFDFDDNVAFLTTPAFIFHKANGSEIRLTSGEFAQVQRQVGVSGPYAEYKMDFNDQTGTFRHFRDQDMSWLERNLMRRKQVFVQDLAGALGFPDLQWKGPSWSCFYHATLNNRPVSMITARGHAPQTIRDGVRLFVERGHLPHEPNYLSLYPVSHPATRFELGDTKMTMNVATLKKLAIRASVEKAIEVYGPNPYHRFGMSDDDPHNVELIVEVMKELKTENPQMSFFVIETAGGRFVKWEVYSDHAEATLCAKSQDLQSFEQLDLMAASSDSGSGTGSDRR